MELGREIRADLQELIFLMGKLQERIEQGHVLSTSPTKPKSTENIPTELERDLMLKTQAAGQEKKPKTKTSAEQEEQKEGVAEKLQKIKESRRPAKKNSNSTKMKTGLFGTYRLKKQSWSSTSKQVGLAGRNMVNMEKVLPRPGAFNMKDFRRSRRKGTERDPRASDVRSPG